MKTIQILGFSCSTKMESGVITDIIHVSSWVLLPRSLDHEFGRCFEQVLFPFAIFHPDRTTLSSLITSLAVSSDFFVFIAAAHATRAGLDVDGSTISHMRNYWYKYLNSSSLQNWSRWALRSENMDLIVVEYVWTLPYWIPWEPLFHPIAELCWG